MKKCYNKYIKKTKQKHTMKGRYHTMANKITKRTVINAMLQDKAIKGNEMYVTYLTHELELLDKKSANRKPTKTQVENDELKDKIFAVLSAEKGLTVSEIMARDDELSGKSNQKITALLRQMISAEIVRKDTDEKRRSIFSIVE